MSKRGLAQVSMEFFIVVLFAFLIIVPVTFYFLRESQSSANEVNIAQISKIGRTIAANAETVYAFGEPTTFTLRVYMPPGVESIYFNNTDIYFVVNNNGLITTISERLSMNVSGNINNYVGLHRIRLQAVNNSVVISES